MTAKKRKKNKNPAVRIIKSFAAGVLVFTINMVPYMGGYGDDDVDVDQLPLPIAIIVCLFTLGILGFAGYIVFLLLSS